MSPIRILIAEDDDRDFELIEMTLQESGYSTDLQRVRDGIEATEYLLGREPYGDRGIYRFPDVILLDIKMPRMNGFEFLEWLQTHPQQRVVPTMVMSSSAVPTDVERAYNTGAHSYFVKPIERGRFVELFHRIAAYWAVAEIPRAASRAR